MAEFTEVCFCGGTAVSEDFFLRQFSPPSCDIHFGAHVSFLVLYEVLVRAELFSLYLDGISDYV